MRFLVKLFPEITIKSRPVRHRFVRQLRRNIRAALKHLDPAVRVCGQWDIIEVISAEDDDGLRAQLLERLICTPGIAAVFEVEQHPLPSLDGMLQLALAHYGAALEGKTFAVRCRRSGKHSFRSVDVERHVGAGLCQQTGAVGVNLDNPELKVVLEIRHEDFYIVTARHVGMGGYPLGCQDSVLSLISGGFDSAVSSYMCIRRGLRTHYCFFNLGGSEHELAVKELALYLWLKYHSTHRVKFITVPFEGVVKEILDKVESSQMGVVLKRMMLRAADQIARQLDVSALATGESVAQVSSQTLANLAVIDSVCETLVLRPLSTVDKQQIIDIAREIGTEQFSRNIPEYCAVISDKPTTKARPERIAQQEECFDFAVLERAVAAAHEQVITEIGEAFAGGYDAGGEVVEVPVLDEPVAGGTVIDLRHPVEVELKPLSLNIAKGGLEVLNIPFYALRTDFAKLDPAKQYLLYCDRGMMSRLHAAHLRDQGFSNVSVLAGGRS
ncbi:MAG: tRNA uracil 4-sulfurtransferase ThiI [Pseudohongiellaceae bacterium]